MNKIFASLLCYSLTLPLVIYSAEAPARPSTQRKMSRSQMTTSARERKNQGKKASPKEEPKRTIAYDDDEEKEYRPVRPQKKAQYTSQRKRYSSKRRPILLAEADDDEDDEQNSYSAAMSDCEKEPNRFRFSFAHREGKGIGYDQGYSSLDFFFAFTTIKNVTPFFDIRGHATNDGKPAANVGFGLRYLPDTLNVVFGMNTFFDFRNARHTTFEQMGVGLEALGTQWKYNINGYFPIMERDVIYDANFYKFSGHRVLVNLLHETAMPGFDTSIARSIIHRGFFDLDAYLGGYYFYGRQDLSAKGGYLKLRSSLSRFCTVEVQGSYDNLFKWIAQGAAAINVPLGKRIKTTGMKRTCYEKIALTRNLTDSVSRFEMIVTHSNREVTEGLDPRTSQPLYVNFVNNTAPGDGNGTAENPYRKLKDAEKFSSPGQMIYVYSGDGTDNNMNVGVTLQDSQWLQGSGLSFNVLTKEELITVPAQTGLYPYISAILTGPIPGNTCVTLANNNTIDGVRIKSNYLTVYGHEKTNGNITNNIIEGPGTGIEGIYLTDFAGTWNITGNTITTSEGMYAASKNVSIVNILQNTFQNSGDYNLQLLINESGESNVTCKQNTFTNSKRGVAIETSNHANVVVRMTDNTLSNITGPVIPSSTSALTIASLHQSYVTALLARNTLNVSSEIATALITEDNSTGYFVLQGNSSNTSSSNLSSIGITASTLGSSTATVSLTNNSASGAAQIFLDQNGPSTYYLQSPTLSLSGVQNQNPATIQTDGNITYVPYTAPVIK